MVGGLTVALLPLVSSASTPKVSDSTFNTSFSTMKYLKSVVKKGHGSIAAILPDTKSSARYTEFDAPYLIKAFKAAGLTKKQYIVQNAQGSDATQFAMAQADIAKGAKVLLVDPLDSVTGASIEAYAKGRGVKVIDYDRLTLGGQRTYYVSFDNVKVGGLIGSGEVSCLTDWNVPSPQVLYISYGSPTDNNATLFAQGYNKVLSAAGFNTSATTLSGSKQSVLESAGTWDGPTALTDFQGAYTAHPSINAVLTPNDNNASGIIAYLQSKGLKPKTIPFTGQDASLIGFENVISGYQCGTVYKPIWLEAQAAAALAVYLRAGVKPPTGLVNGSTPDTLEGHGVPSVLLTATWVTADKVEATVVKDKVIVPSQLCTNTAPTVPGDPSIPTYAADCTTFGIH
ncbi:MAG: sugar ABC transporter substrate-binding protein [Acidimicrobiales bacterium]